MRKPSAPCLGCQHREVGCHSKCDTYIEYRKLMDEHKYDLIKYQEENELRFGKLVKK